MILFDNSKLYKLPSETQSVEVINRSDNSDLLVCLSQKIGDESTKKIIINLLKSLNYRFEDVNCLLVSDSANLSEYFNLQHLKYVFFFGIQPQNLGLKLNYSINTFYELNGKKLLFTNALIELDKNEALKKPLWGALKLVFKEQIILAKNKTS